MHWERYFDWQLNDGGELYAGLHAFHSISHAFICVFLIFHKKSQKYLIARTTQKSQTGKVKILTKVHSGISILRYGKGTADL